VTSSSGSLELFAPLIDHPRQAGLFIDFDGTLAAIVDDPNVARPMPTSAEALDDLAEILAVVGVISGRPVDFVAAFFKPTVRLAGLYGLETRFDGERRDHPLGGVWREVVADVATQSVARGPVGMRVEAKGLSLTLHYRGAPEIEHDVRAWAEQQGARAGLVVRPAKMSYELHPPIEIDKGTTLLELADGLAAVCFIGDDVGDLPAFDALDELDGRGVHTVRVAVHSPEESRELVERADLVVDGPPGVAALLSSVLARAAR
jgi:trehalose 6-phosphate phosphatase